MRFVFIGAGPVSLSAAIMLVNKGIKPADITICDPRASVYTRPGSLVQYVFKSVEQYLDKNFWDGGDGHIKDLERKLEEIAKELKINIINKKFVGLEEGGVYVGEGSAREFITCEYVFDGSGSKRVVINDLNNKLPSNPPFKIENIPEVSSSHYFLAYIQVDWEQYKRLVTPYNNLIKKKEYIPDMDYCRNLLKLRNLGWQEYALPIVGGALFDKESNNEESNTKKIKACFYLNAPRDLKPGKYEDWVNAVFKTYDKNAQYSHPKKSKKYASKPRFLPFTVGGQVLTGTFSHQQQGFPCVIPIGDAVIDPHFRLANAILHGIQRSNRLFNTMTVSKSEGEIITPLDLNSYGEQVAKLVTEQKQEIKNQYTEDQEYFHKGLQVAQRKLLIAITLTHDNAEKKAFIQLLQDVNKCLEFEKISVSTDLSDRDLTQATNTLLEINKNNGKPLAGHQLPALPQALAKLALDWKTKTLDALSHGNLENARNYYQQVVTICTLRCFRNSYTDLIAAELNETINRSAIAQLATPQTRQNEEDVPSNNSFATAEEGDDNLETLDSTKFRASLITFAHEMEERSPKKRAAIPFFKALHIDKAREKAQTIRLIAESSLSDEQKKTLFSGEINSLLQYLKNNKSVRTYKIINELLVAHEQPARKYQH